MAYNILIVDDSRLARAVIRKTLRIAQVPLNQVFEACNGQEGLDVLGKEWIDLVFADIHMPVLDGEQMITHMQKDGLLATIPVLVVSSDGGEHRIDHLISKGVRGYLRKPITPERIAAITRELLGDIHE